MSSHTSILAPSHTGSWNGQHLELYFNDFDWVDGLAGIAKAELDDLETIKREDPTPYCSPIERHLRSIYLALITILLNFKIRSDSTMCIEALKQDLEGIDRLEAPAQPSHAEARAFQSVQTILNRILANHRIVEIPDSNSTPSLSYTSKSESRRSTSLRSWLGKRFGSGSGQSEGK
jgi:hypothetical protein